MPLASWDDVVDEPAAAAPTRASFADIVSIEPAAPQANLARFEDIETIEPIAPPKPALPTGPIAIARSVKDATAGIPGQLPTQPITIARSPAAATATLKPRAEGLQPAPPVAQDPITPVVREFRGGVGDTAKGALDFFSSGLRGTRDVQVDASGKLVAEPAQPDPLLQPIATGAAAVRDAYARTKTATSPAELDAAMWETVNRAAALPLDTLGVPVTQIREALQEKNYGRAGGLLTGLVALLGGLEGAHSIAKSRPPIPLEDRLPPAAVPQVATPADVIAIEPPTSAAPAADAAPIVPPSPDLVAPGHEAAYNNRRTQDVGAPGGVERRKLPAEQVLDDFKDPDMVRRAEEMRARAADAREQPQTASIDDIVRVDPPPADVAGPASTATDRGATMGASHEEGSTAGTRAGDLAPGAPDERATTAGVGDESPRRGRQGARAAQAEEAARAEHEALHQTVTDAVAAGYAGNPEQLHAELRDRLALYRELDAALADSDHGPDRLLKDIAHHGGISLSRETALQGEIRRLKEFQDRTSGTPTRPRFGFGQFRGVQGVLRESGLSVDDMLTTLQQNDRYQHITSASELLDEIERAATTHRPDAAIKRLIAGLGNDWWANIGHAEDLEPGAATHEATAVTGEHDAIEPSGDVGSVDFNPADLETVDTLDTGEQQPRLPDAGGVRDVEHTAADIADVPFSLTGEAADRRAAQPSFLEGEKPTFGTKRPDVDEVLSMPNPKRRADASGALVPSPASRAMTRLAGERQLRPSEIVAELSRSLDALPVRVGKFNAHALGIYKPREQTIRLKVANDLATLAHELGHHIHETVMGSDVPPKAHRAELLRLGEPTSRASYTLKQRLQEGQAEFTREWLSDPARAHTLAPTYAAAFEAALAQHPELQAILERAQRQYIGHLSLDPVTRGLAHIDFEGGDPRPKTDVVTRLQTAWVDDLYPLRRMEEDLAHGEPVDLTRSGYALARLARGATAKADGFLRHGVRAPDGTFLAAALEPALKPVRKQIREFAGYLTALRAIELRTRGMETGMSLEEARAIVEKFQSPEFDKARDAVYSYQDGLLVYATHAGAMSADQLVAMKTLNQHYVPFQRVMDDVGAAAAGGGSSIANKASPVKRIKGSGRDIINPLESIVRNTHALVAMVEQNRAMTELVRQAQAKGGGRYLEAIPDKQIATTFNLDKLARVIRQELDDAGVDIPDNLDFDRVVTVFTPTQLRIGEKGIVSVLHDGERRWFAVNDPALYDAIAGMGPQASNLITNLLAKPARYLRAGATTTIGFIARNPIRDTFEATVNSRYGFVPGLDTIRGLFEFAKHGEDYEHFLNSGAGNAAMVGMDRNRLRQELARLGAADKRRIADSLVLNPINLLQAISEAMEHATRLGEFMKGVEQEGRTAEGYARAALAARDVTIDFARGGTASKEINRYTAFFNAGVQGAARLVEVFGRDPRGATMRAAAAITIPTLALYALNRSDPAYRELPDWERNSYWHIPTGAGAGHSWARVPKPFTLGQIFGNAFEVALGTLADKHPEDLLRVLPDRTTAWRQVISLFPTALMPAVEVYTNYDTFRDRAIVTPDDLKLDPALQYNRWTSELAKFVGPKLGVAPAKLDHLIYGYGAGLASGTVQAVDRTAEALGLTARKKPAGGPARWPLTGSFWRETPGADALSLEDFYRARDEMAGDVGSVTRYAKTEGNAAAKARLEQLKARLGPNAGTVAERLKAAESGLKDLRDGVNAVFASPSLAPEEKKELLDRIYEQMVNTARAGLGRVPLPSRFPKPPASALLQKLSAGVTMLNSPADAPAAPVAPAARPAAPPGNAAPAAP